MKPIFEINGSDWMKGLSLQSTSAQGGLFYRARGFDPFEKMDTFYPSLESTERGSGTIVTDINQIVPFDNSGTPSAYLVSNRNSSNKGLYRVNLSTGAVTDISSSIHTNLGAGATSNVQFAMYYRGSLLYQQESALRKFDGSNDSNVGSLGSGPLYYKRGCVAEGTLYVPNVNSVYTVNSSFTLGSSAYDFPTSFRVLDLQFDGDYLVMIGDENQVSGSIGNLPTQNLLVRCQVRYWNRTSGTATRIWDIPDSYLIGIGQLDGMSYVFGSKGIWTCSISQPPRLFRAWSTGSINEAPTSPYQITASNNSIYWIGGTGINQDVYAYGSPYAGEKNIWYCPYIAHGSNYSGRSLSYTGNHFLVGTSSSHVFETSSGTARSSTVRTVPIRFGTPHKFEKVVVHLLSPLSSGQTVTFSATQGNDSVVISDSNIYSFVTKSDRQSLVYRINPSSGSSSLFKEIILTLTTEGGVVVTGFQLFGTPQDPHLEF